MEPSSEAYLNNPQHQCLLDCIWYFTYLSNEILSAGMRTFFVAWVTRGSRPSEATAGAVGADQSALGAMNRPLRCSLRSQKLWGSLSAMRRKPRLRRTRNRLVDTAEIVGAQGTDVRDVHQ